MWQHWVNFVLSLWLVLSGYIGLSAAAMLTDLTIVGIAMAILAVWGAVEDQSYYHAHEHDREHAHG